MSRVDKYTGTGDDVRCVNVLPSDRTMSWVNVYGLRGRRRRVAWRHCEQMNVGGVEDGLAGVKRAFWRIVDAERRNGVTDRFSDMIMAGEKWADHGAGCVGGGLVEARLDWIGSDWIDEAK